MLYSSLFQGDLVVKKGKCKFQVDLDMVKCQSRGRNFRSPDLALQIFVDEIFLKWNYVALGGLCPFENSPRFRHPFLLSTLI